MNNQNLVSNADSNVAQYKRAKITIDDNLTIHSVGGFDGFSQNSVSTQFLVAKLNGWEVDDGAALFFAFEKMSDGYNYSVGPILASQDFQLNTYWIQMPDDVMKISGNWRMCVYKKSNFNQDTGTADKVMSGVPFPFQIKNSIRDSVGQITVGDLISVINSYTSAKESISEKLKEVESSYNSAKQTLAEQLQEVEETYTSVKETLAQTEKINVTAEAQRVLNEQERAENEIARKTAEQEREAAEAQRGNALISTNAEVAKANSNFVYDSAMNLNPNTIDTTLTGKVLNNVGWCADDSNFSTGSVGIPVTAGKQYCFSYNGNPIIIYKVVWKKNNSLEDYDASNYLGSSSAYPDTPLTAPEGANYLFFSVQNSSENTIATTVCQKGALPKPVGEVVSSLADTVSVPMMQPSPLYGKKMMTLGDSLSEAGIWQAFVQQITGISNIVNLSVGGTTVNVFADNVTADNIADVDIVFIMGLFNNTSSPAGNVTDEASNNASASICAQYKYVVEKIYSLKPSVRIVLASPHRPSANDVADKAAAVGEVAKYYGIEFIDLYNTAGFNTSTNGIYLADSVHSSTAGYKQEAQVIAYNLMSYSSAKSNKVEDITSTVMNPTMHANIYRGKNLGASVTAEQKTAIQDGTFKDLFVGDYWVINGVTWRIADMDYFYNVGYNALTKHHIVIVPDTHLYTTKMNSTRTTDGGYVGSEIYKTGLEQAKTTIGKAFGDLVVAHEDFLTNAVQDGHASGAAWFNSTVDLMNEIMVYGCYVKCAMGNGSVMSNTDTTAKKQFSLFRFTANKFNQRTWFWLRDVVSSTRFAVVAYGRAFDGVADGVYGVRPYFIIG